VSSLDVIVFGNEITATWKDPKDAPCVTVPLDGARRVTALQLSGTYVKTLESWWVGEDAKALINDKAICDALRIQSVAAASRDSLVHRWVGGLGVLLGILPIAPDESTFLVAATGEIDVPFWLVYAIRRFKWPGRVLVKNATESRSWTVPAAPTLSWVGRHQKAAKLLLGEIAIGQITSGLAFGRIPNRVRMARC
jgi:hypothetical protein